MKRITKQSHIKAGWYIRAYVNYHGSCSYRVIELFGKPFIFKDEFNDELAWKIKSRIITKFFDHKTESYLTDLYCNSSLFKFSHKNKLKLDQLLQHGGGEVFNRKFTEFIQQKTFTDAEWEEQMDDWTEEKRIDDEFLNSLDKEVFPDAAYEALEDGTFP